jgi:hypothetical protein
MKEFSAGIVIKFNDHGLHGLVTDTDLIADWQMEYVFRSHLTYALEKANEFYLEKREQVLASFNSCAHAVDAIAQVTLLQFHSEFGRHRIHNSVQVHHEREKRFLPAGSSHGSGHVNASNGPVAPGNVGDKGMFSDIVSPTNSTEHMWPRRSPEEVEAMSSAFLVRSALFS